MSTQTQLERMKICVEMLSDMLLVPDAERILRSLCAIRDEAQNAIGYGGVGDGSIDHETWNGLCELIDRLRDAIYLFEQLPELPERR